MNLKNELRIDPMVIEPLNSHTNEVLARELGPNSQATEVPYKQGIIKNVWLTDTNFVKKFRASKGTLGDIQFNLYHYDRRGILKKYPRRRRRAIPRIDT